MSLAALAQEKFWENKAQCEDAEKAYYMRLSGAKVAAPEKKDDDELDLFASDDEPEVKPALVKPTKPAKAPKKAPKQEQPQVDKAEAMAGTGGAASAEVLKKLKDLELENKDLKQVTKDLKAMVLKLEGRVAALEKNKPAAAAAAPAPAKAAAPADDDDDDVDLFGSDEEEEEEDAAAAKIREERLAAYAAKKATKKAVIAKTSVCLDIKPWDDETDMNEMLKQVKTIEKDGLIWGASKLVPVGYGINKLRIVMVVEDEKVSIDEVQEQIAEFEDFVQSVDVESMQKI